MNEETTTHGENIANEIQGEDAYGASGPLTNADVYLIIDTLHSAMMDERAAGDPIFAALESAMHAIEDLEVQP